MLLTIFCLNGCGQKGPLYLPEKPQTSPKQPSDNNQ
ncbi:lipoprotein [Catenovulum sp. 2E275]|nr:lipoprotein [Catenovulum sp. 2E275]MCU4675035.1 lipoprotein [Catenovulum sp. 2E275]